MPRSAPSARSRHPGLLAVVLLTLALGWAQWLGLLHGVWHHTPGHGAVHASTPALAASAAHASAHGVAPAGLLAHLLAPDGDDSECRLYDQLGQGSALTSLPLALPVLVPLWPAWVAVLPRLAAPCHAFAARAPPRSR